MTDHQKPCAIEWVVIPAPNLERAKVFYENGGRVLRPRYALGPNAGFCARFEDPNGNAYELYQAE
jgi:predicted enzyme related to lactoylglutathione lyase